jgi:hypothetical protein
MKIGKLTTSRTLPCFITFLGATLVLLRAQSPSPETKPDPWTPLRSFIGHWEGESHGEPGHGMAERTYTFILNNRFIQETHKSVYPPQEKNLKGETHEHVGFFSYDKAAKKTHAPSILHRKLRLSLHDREHLGRRTHFSLRQRSAGKFYGLLARPRDLSLFE